MSITVKEKVVVVTGAGAGIGRAVAELFAREGAKVVVTDVDDEGAGRTVELIKGFGGEAIALHQDVTSEDGWIETLAKSAERFGGIDVLINNAGIYVIASLEDTTLEMWNRMMAINVTGTFLGAKHVVPFMEKRGGGSIVNLSSIAGIQGSTQHAAYGTSKGAVRIMTKHLAAELGSRNIRVNSVHPTYVKTAMADYAAGVTGASIEQLGASLSLLGRLVEVDDVANMIVFLAAEESRYLTASEFLLDGGGSSAKIEP